MKKINDISNDAIIHENVKIGKNVTISPKTIIYPNVKIGDNTFIGPYSIIGEPTLNYYQDKSSKFLSTKIGKDCIVRSHNVIYDGVIIGDNLQTGHHVTIREETEIGNNCSIGTLSDLQGKLKLGNFVRLHSNVHLCQLTEVEDYVWIYPYVVTTNDPYPPTGKLIGSKIRKFAQIFTGAKILPGKEIGENSLVGAGAIVTKDVPPSKLVVGVPAKEICDVTDIKNENNQQIYPWKDFLKEYRGYPWQSKK